MFSLVTACMNREAHLRQNLPHWLQLPGLAEIVVVDWSNCEPLAGLRALDRRVKVVRVDGEQQWILSYAYNLGIAHAACPTILKCDADCRPRAEIAACVPAQGRFFAGNWRSGAAAGKPSVNGQCIFLRTQFDAVNGYSEVIRSYGRDDEDFYDRLIANGQTREEISPAWLDFLEHTHAERTSNQADALDVGHEFLRGTGFKEIRNYFLAQAMPWSAAQSCASYATLHTEDRLSVLRRDRTGEIPIPPEVELSARLSALRHFAAQMAGLTTDAATKLNEVACLAVITARLKARTASSD